MSDVTRHLSDERIQDFLDGRLPERDASRVRAHVDECARCRAEVEGWRALLFELSDLPALAPGVGFEDRVLASVPQPVPKPAPARVRATLGAWLVGSGLATDGTHEHPDAARIQDFVDGALRRRSAAAVRRHLEACDRCRTEARSWAALLGGLDALPRFSPSPGFAHAVMRGVSLAPSPAHSLGRRLLDRGRRIVGPQRRRAWAAAAGMALTPAVTLGAVAYAVFSHPLVTFGNLLGFAWLKVSTLAAGLGGGWIHAFVAVGSTLRTWGAFDALTRSPTAAGAGALAFCALTMASAWVVYRNVIAPEEEVARVGR